MRASLSSVDSLRALIDRAVVSGLTLLVVATPIAIGAVNRGAIVAMELVIFGLAGMWIARWALDGVAAEPNPSLLRSARRLSLPVAAMTALVVIQLTPLPPQSLDVLSPAVYRLYQIVFPGSSSRQEQPAQSQRTPAATVRSLTGSASTAITSGTRGYKSPKRRWRPLTLSPAMTWASLLELLALATLFFLVLLYPISKIGGRSTEASFVRGMICLVVATAAAIALLGISERAWWNGKILWFYQPGDWQGPLLVDAPRASGPFVNPDHFANYLALTLPSAIAGALFPSSLISSDKWSTIRLFFAGTAVVSLIAAMLSLSRGGGLAIFVGVTLMLSLCFRHVPNLRPLVLKRLRLGAVPLAIVTFVLIAGLTFYFIGEPARGAVGTRLLRTSGNDFSARLAAWHETLPMISDFPLFGVGAGGWPEIFPHYQPPPESRYYFFRTAENDYIQFVAEDGIAGLLILSIFATLLISGITKAARSIPSWRWPLFAGLLGGLSGGLVQEFVDSSLRIPANALLFTILLGLLLRVAFDESTEGSPNPKPAERAIHRSNVPLLLAPLCVVLMIAIWNQDGRAYVSSLDHPADLNAVSRNLVNHPAMAAVHLAMAQMMPDGAQAQRRELLAAVWLDPNEPLARDLLARNLLMAGRKSEALKQISTSVYRAPFLQFHYYLAPSAIRWLLPEEQEAVVRGFNQAIDSDFAGAADELNSFYLQLGRERDAAAAFEHAAKVTSVESRRLDFLLDAGRQYATLQEYVNGGRALLLACRVDPADARAYAELAELVYGPQNMLSAAAAIVDQGIKAGADPYALEMALGRTAQTSGHNQIAEAAFSRAIDYDPSFDAMFELGRVYFAEERFGRAASTLEQATELNPQSANAFMWLGRAHEANFDYYRAARAYRRALSLAPGDAELRRQYHEFQQRAGQETSQPGSKER